MTKRKAWQGNPANRKRQKTAYPSQPVDVLDLYFCPNPECTYYSPDVNAVRRHISAVKDDCVAWFKKIQDDAIQEFLEAEAQGVAFEDFGIDPSAYADLFEASEQVRPSLHSRNTWVIT